MFGVVVACLDENGYATGYSKEDWGHLGHGVLVNSPEAGLVYFAYESPDLMLIGGK